MRTAPLPRRALTSVVLVASVALLASGPAGAAQGATLGVAATTSPTVWLCEPGTADDPCTTGLTTAVVGASGATAVQPGGAAPNPSTDCFYVYPTVSQEPTANADLRVQPAEVKVAEAQAARFSQVCRVWAPMYRQRTTASIARGLGSDPAANTVAYDSLVSAFEDYLAHDNGGSSIVFIGHSQGAAVLIRLLRAEVDDDPALRAQVVSAILLGGNVTVPTGRTVGSTFRHLPLCSRTDEIGCVIAYSSFPSEPPVDSNFGRPGQGVSLQSGQTQKKGVAVACVNPAAISGGTGLLEPYFPLGGRTEATVGQPWISFPALYAARCETRGGATWLQVSDVARRGDARPVVTEAQGPAWGYHAVDVNLALGNLVTDVADEEAAYLSAHL